MLDNASTTPVQAMQLWLEDNLEETGWPLASPVMDAYAEPFNTWAVMDQTLDKESWPQNALPFGIAYFCNNREGVLPPTREGFEDYIKQNRLFPQEESAKVREQAKVWLQTYAGHIWPNLAGPEGTGFDWSKLVDLENREGEHRLKGQFFLGEVEPTLRYVCNPAGSGKYRLRTDGSDFTNLFLAGDWIDIGPGGLNLGCVETTVTAGLQAAEALTGYDQLVARRESPV
jgi:uncharacterized protein with NAD-binding domain and iron-sulfur cluster